jgi:hypothetical protein
VPGIGRQRGIFTSCSWLLNVHHEEMAKRFHSTSVQIAPCSPLAHAGFTRVVTRAGLTLAAVGDKPDVIVRNDVHFAPSSPGTPIQVGVQSDRVVIVVATPPEVSTWLAVHDLLGCLLESLASPGPNPGALRHYTG